MSNDLKNFFDGATPAEINQLHIDRSAQQEQPAPQPEEPQQSALEAIAQVEQETKQEIAPEPQPALIEHQETPQQVRFREMREAKLKAEWEREEMGRRLRAYEEAAKRPQAQEEQEEDWIKADEIVEGRHVKQLVKKIREESKREVQQQQQALHQMMLETRLKMEMPDIDQVVSAENLRKLAQEMPEVARALDDSPDLYIKAKSAYTLIKKFNSMPLNPPVIDDTKQRIAANLAKPKPVQAVARQSPLAAANAYDGPLSDDMKQKLYKEMMHAIRNG